MAGCACLRFIDFDLFHQFSPLYPLLNISEIVQLSEKCENLNSALELAQQKMAIFEQMVNAANNSAKARAASNTFENAAGGDRSDAAELLATLKNVATKVRYRHIDLY
jgi:hypothetical protein